MDARRWARVQEVFHAVADARPADREALLKTLCAKDADLRREVEQLLAAEVHGAPALDATPFDLLGLLDEDDAFEVESPSASSTPSAPDLPERVGPYRVLGELGRGGMGLVYRAVRVDGVVTREVALKVVAESLVGTKLRDEVSRRFQRECRILAGLEHPGIGRLYEAGVADDGRPFMAMELIEGEPIHRYCDARRLGVAERLRLFEQVAAAVDFAHRQLVLHRDLKPSNILVTEDGTVKLLDFGIAKLLRQPGSDGPDLPDAPLETQVGRRVFTPEFASPEQLRGDALSAASDVFSLGVLLHQLLTGKRPVVDPRSGIHTPPSTSLTRTGGASEAAAFDPGEIASARATTPGRLARTLEGELDALLLTALRDEPDRRYPSAAALLDDLVRWREGRPLSARAPTLGYRARKFVRRNRVSVGAVGAVAVSLVVGFGVAVQQARAARSERDIASAVSGLLEGLFASTDPLAPGERRDTLPVAAFLGEAVDEVEELLGDQPEIQARMRRILGTAYANLGAYADAEPLLEAAIGDDRTLASDRRAALLTLGRMEMARADYAKAAVTYRRGLAAAEAEFGVGSTEVAELQLELAGALLNAGVLDEAETLILAALEVRGGDLGEDALTVSQSLNMLGSLQFSRRDFESALVNMRRAVDLIRTEMDPDDPQAAIMAQNLGLVLLRADRPEEAEPVLRESFEALQRRMLPDFPILGEAMRTWANALNELDRWAEAEPLYREALAHGRRVTPGQDPEMRARIDYGRSLLRRDRWDEARPLLEEAHAIAERLDVAPAASAAATFLAEGHRAAGDEVAAARWEALTNRPAEGGR